MTTWLRGGVAAWSLVMCGIAKAQPGEPVLVEADPELKTWVRPEYPEELRRAKQHGEVTIHLVVQADGSQRDQRVASTTDDRFNEAVLTAVKQWTFFPGVHQGRAAETGVGVRWIYTLPYAEAELMPPPHAYPAPLPKTPAVAGFVPSPPYPVTLLDRRIDGEVVFEVDVDAGGAVAAMRILHASHGDFVVTAVDTLRRWRFKPALQGTVPVVDKKIIPMAFEYDMTEANDGITPLRANGFSFDLPDGVSPSQVCEQHPAIRTTSDPVFPLELLNAPTEAEAEVSFVLPISGVPTDLRIEHASHPAAGASLAASVRASAFKPAVKEGRAIEVRLQRNWRFERQDAAALGGGESHSARLMRHLLSGQAVASAKGLDTKLTPLWRAAPLYPHELRDVAVSGTAEVEVLIDPDGRVRLPRVVRATHEAFGWAAATALTHWVFEKPTRGGEPTDVRVRIPVSFTPGN